MAADDYAWFDDHDSGLAESFCVTFVRGLTPREAFDRLGVVPDSEADDSYEEAICASAVAGGTILIEFNGFAGTSDTVAGLLSPGTVTAAVFGNINLDRQFVYSADGQVVTEFEPDFPGSRSGTDPDRLLAHMAALGMPTEDVDAGGWGNPIHTALALAERVTGVRLTPEAIDHATLIGSSSHLVWE
ncbi:hypothetical protein GCM10009555_088140 [Acrocarpospora macrocephala]|uniref:Uncharacterized protein n=1 Tax=Acrocarpospora macrocephala TaxID=150177 RepID=A0A5M3X4Z3_9ACTN|nr:DUF6461 domain-containing protein [Acrocarpospora macrocephala]GES16785.1 hypothetical protein Amac_103830 [Acrocarpospora macrocephala]